MATLLLTSIGTLVGGPVGGAVGSLLGSQIDRVIFAPKGRDGPRLDDLAVQGSDYGVPLPRHFGTVRSAGTIIWSTGLKETAHRSGGGKKSGGRTTTYSYSASFAIALAARPIAGVGRIWADGKLLRGAAGDMHSGGAVRIHTGAETQLPDALIEAAEGMGNAPAYRGRAYAVFEDLELADYANRIPNLSFEIVADTDGTDAGRVLADLARQAGAEAETAGLGAPMRGFSAARNSSAASYIAALDALDPIVVTGTDRRIRLAGQDEGDAFAIAPETMLAAARSEPGAGWVQRQRPDDLPGTVSFAFSDPARDYQPGVQRAFRGGVMGAGERHLSLSAALDAGGAKRAAEAYLGELWSRRDTARRRVPLALASMAPGDRLAIAGEAGWMVRRTEFAGLALDVELERRRSAPLADAAADSGAALLVSDVPQGETVLEMFELPPLGTETPGMARLWLAAGGASEGWRRAEFWISLDGGATWRSAGVASTPAKMGTAMTALPAADWAVWDETGAVDIDLVDDQLLASAGRASVLAGANLARIGDELVQFRSAEQLAPRRFRLSGLLRGRRGTEAAVATHAAGDAFVLIEPEALFPLDLPLDAIGTNILVKAAGPNDAPAAVPARQIGLAGEWLKPLRPVHLTGRFEADGTVALSWIRRSRTGFAWLDGADAPLGEESEHYRVTLAAMGQAFEADVMAATFSMDSGAQIAAFGGMPPAVDVTLAQISAAIGAGGAAGLRIERFQE